MFENDGQKLNRVEEMKNRLFSKSYNTEIKHQNSFSSLPQKEVRDSWPQEPGALPEREKFFMQTSTFKKFFVFSIVFFVAAVAYASYMFFVGGNTVSNDNIDISVLGNTFTAGGEDLPLVVEITNRNNSSLDLVDLVVEYPQSASAASSQDMERIRESIGTIPAGSVRSENLKVVLYGEQGTTRTIKISIEYRVEGSNAIFVKDKTYDVSINSSPLNLSFDAPSTVSSNQDMTLSVKAVLNANKVVPGVVVKVDYPLGFEFISSKPAPTLGNNIWSLADLAPGAERNIEIEGKMVEVSDGEEKTFRVWSGTQSTTDKSLIGVVFNSLSDTISIKKPSIEAKLYINGEYSRQYASGSKDRITGEVHWANNLDTKINDMVVSARITGNVLDRQSIRADQGFYDSAKNTIIWDKNSQRDFASVNPGEAGVLTFSMSPSSFSSGAASSDPSINVEVSIAGKQAGDGFSFSDLSNKETKSIKISSDVGFGAKAVYYSGPFANTGPIPPKVEQATTYTITWSLSNTSNNISKAKVRATLPSWVQYTNNTSPKSEDLVYNPSTKEITWNAGNLPKGTGISSGQKEVSFQVSLSPSLSQIGTTPVLVNDAVLTGRDDFANVDVSVSRGSINTRLTSDPAFPFNGDRVVAE